MLSHSQFASRLDGEPHLLHPEAGSYLSKLPDALNTDVEALTAASTVWGNDKPYELTADGIAVIPVHGYLAHRVDSHYAGWYTGYDYISALLSHANTDPQVKGIALDVNSHGGTVSGAFELADEIANSEKPVWAILDANAHSAAYLLSAAADKIIIPQAGSVGSIGVVTMHVDQSKMLDNVGIKVTMIYAGKYKVDGNSFEPLSEEVKSRIEARLEASYKLFVDSVSSNRNMNPDAIRATEAGTFQGDLAVEAGLADAVMSPRAAYAAFSRMLNQRGSVMSKLNEAVKAEQVDAAQEAAAPVDTAAVMKQGASAERVRIAEILGCAEAEGRDAMAKHLAFNTEMSVADAKALLNVSPTAAAAPAAATANAFEAAMTSTGNPNVGADGAVTEASHNPVASVVGNWKSVTGRK